MKELNSAPCVNPSQPPFVKGGVAFVHYVTLKKSFARKLRSSMTRAEIILWDEVLRKDKTSYRFLRQKILGPFVADFYCSKLMLVIEVDGESHIGREDYDANRTLYLNQLGIKVIRFMNRDIEMNINQCILLLKEELHKRYNELHQTPPG